LMRWSVLQYGHTPLMWVMASSELSQNSRAADSTTTA